MSIRFTYKIHNKQKEHLRTYSSKSKFELNSKKSNSNDVKKFSLCFSFSFLHKLEFSQNKLGKNHD